MVCAQLRRGIDLDEVQLEQVQAFELLILHCTLFAGPTVQVVQVKLQGSARVGNGRDAEEGAR